VMPSTRPSKMFSSVSFTIGGGGEVSERTRGG